MNGMRRSGRRSLCLMGVVVLAITGSLRADPLRIAVSILPQAWIVERLGGDDVEVVVVVSPGESPATFQPSDVQVSRVAKSEIYFCLGMPFENGPWFRAIRQSRGLELVDQRLGVDLLPQGQIGKRETCRYRPGSDPHVWLSPRRLQVQAATVAAALIAHAPREASAIRQRLEGLVKELEGYRRELEERLRPFAGSTFFVFHPTWGYLADDFDLRQVPIETHGQTPSDHEMTDLRRQFTETGSRVLFVQPQIAGRAARASAELLGAALVEIDPLMREVPAAWEAFARALEDTRR